MSRVRPLWAWGVLELRFPLIPKTHLLKWKLAKGTGPSRFGCLELDSGTMIGLLGQPEGMAAKYDLTVEAAGPPLPSREAHVGFSKIFFFFLGYFKSFW